MSVPRTTFALLVLPALLTTAPPYEGTARATAEPLVEVPQKALPKTGFRLSPDGRFAGVLVRKQPQLCDFWSLYAGAYVGQGPAAPCLAWPVFTFKAPADIARAQTTSPDGKLRAVVSDPKIKIVDTATGKLQRALSLGEGSHIFASSLRWGAGGLLVVAKPGDDNGGSFPYAVYHFAAAANYERHAFGLGNPVATDPQLILDPQGRFAFVSLHIDRSGDYFNVLDGPTAMPSILDIRPQHEEERQYQVDAEFSLTSTYKPGRWLGGNRPYWETIQEVRETGGNRLEGVAAWRILAVPGEIRLDVPHALSKRQAPPLRFRKKDVAEMTPQAAQELTQRFTGVRRDTLRRVADGEELTLRDDGCAVSKHGMYSCDAKGLRQRIFRQGADPLTAQVFHGDQLARLLFDPELIEHFFAGAAIPAKPLDEVGRPPEIVLGRVQLTSRPHQLQVSLSVKDGGSGVSEVRARKGDKFLDWRVPVSAGQEMTLSVPLSPGCGHIWIYACDGAGTVCSAPVRVPSCEERRDATGLPRSTQETDEGD